MFAPEELVPWTFAPAGLAPLMIVLTGLVLQRLAGLAHLLFAPAGSVPLYMERTGEDPSTL